MYGFQDMTIAFWVLSYHIDWKNTEWMTIALSQNQNTNSDNNKEKNSILTL